MSSPFLRVLYVLAPCAGLAGLAGACGGTSTTAVANPTDIDSGAADAGPGGPSADAAIATDAAVATDAAPSTPLTFCAGTVIAGSCGQRFFQDISECMHVPNLSACTFDAKASTAGTYCFGGGARVVSSTSGAGAAHAVWTNAEGVVCLETDTTATSETMTRNGQTVRVVTDPTSGGDTLVCADGSKVSLPSGFRSCGDLKALFDWSCTDGACP